MVASWTLDKPGPMCRYVEDCATVLGHVMGADPLDPTAVDAPFEFRPKAPVKGKKIAVLRDEFDMPEDPEMRGILNASLGMLENLDLILEDVELADLPYREVSRLGSIEGASFWEPLIDSPKVNELLRKDRVARWAAARMIPATDYLKMQRIRGEMMRYASELFQQYAALVAPSWMATAWGGGCTGDPRNDLSHARRRPRGSKRYAAAQDQSFLEPRGRPVHLRSLWLHNSRAARGNPVCRCRVRRKCKILD